MYIQKSLTTSTMPIPGLTYELTSDLEAKFWQYKAFSKLVFDENDNLIDIVEDTEKRAEFEAEKEANKPDPLEENLKGIRRMRKRQLQAFDIYKSNLYYGVDAETDEQRQEVLKWYQELLDITESVTVEAIPSLPETPECISKYL